MTTKGGAHWGADALVPPAPPRDPAASLLSFERHAFHSPLLWHRHDDLELTLVLDGQGQRGVGSTLERYGPGDLCLLGEGTAHAWQASPGERVRAVVVHFPRSILGMCESLTEFEGMRKALGAASGLVAGGTTRDAVAREMLALQLEPEGSWQRPLRLLASLATLGNSIELRMLVPPQAAIPRIHRSDERIDRVANYVEQTLPDRVSHTRAATVAGLTGPAFSRLFRRSIGTTFEAYVDQVRIERACQALCAHDCPITAIAFAAGFGSIAHFNRRFLARMGISPSEYRRLARHHP